MATPASLDRTIDVLAMVELARNHPEELEQLREQFRSSEATGVLAEPAPGSTDRWGRALRVGMKVLDPRGQSGRIRRIDAKSERALVAFEDGGSRFIKLGRLEARVGRPRKGSYGTVRVVST